MNFISMVKKYIKLHLLVRKEKVREIRPFVTKHGMESTEAAIRSLETE
jgi:hypothetical protein